MLINYCVKLISKRHLAVHITLIKAIAWAKIPLRRFYAGRCSLLASHKVRVMVESGRDDIWRSKKLIKL